MTQITKHAPSFTAARLYRKTSAKGGTYFTDRMGSVKIALLKSKETADDGGEIWSLVFSEAAPYLPKADDKAAAAKRDYARPAATAEAKRESAPDPLDEAIPF